MDKIAGGSMLNQYMPSSQSDLKQRKRSAESVKKIEGRENPSLR